MIALLDLDETLVDRSAGFAAWARSFVDRWSLTDADLAWLHRVDQEVTRRGQFFDALSARYPHTGSAAELWQDYRARMPHLTQVYPGVLVQLHALRSDGWRLMVVTNGRTDNQLGKLEQTGIADVVDGCVVSEQAGVHKPDPAIFALALRRLGVTERDACWMVGDDPVADIAGGRSAGLRTHWVSHGRSWPADDFHPDRISTSPSEALAALAG